MWVCIQSSLNKAPERNAGAPQPRTMRHRFRSEEVTRRPNDTAPTIVGSHSGCPILKAPAMPRVGGYHYFTSILFRTQILVNLRQNKLFGVLVSGDHI